jgi:hypothetical protein
MGPEIKILKPNNYKGFLIDLIIYISVMFAIREVSIPNTNFLITGLFWSFTTLIVATWRMRVRGVTWKELGLRKPKNVAKTIMISGLILVTILISMLLFDIVKDHIPFLSEPEGSQDSSGSKFGALKGNWPLFFSILPLFLVESFLEELLDRGFLINWFERLFSKTSFATVFAVIFQAAIFGFRHSYDLSARSVSVGIMGLIMGIAYVKFGRNLWPLIIAHCVLNFVSMAGRV